MIKNDIEYVLFMRKGGGYRTVTHAQKVLSMLTKQEMQRWFRSIWDDIKGSSTRNGHPAPFPVELAERLIRMFSFAGDRVLDPFMGQGSTNIAAVLSGRNSLGNELEKAYFEMAWNKVKAEADQTKFLGADPSHRHACEFGSSQESDHGISVSSTPMYRLLASFETDLPRPDLSPSRLYAR